MVRRVAEWDVARADHPGGWDGNRDVSGEQTTMDAQWTGDSAPRATRSPRRTLGKTGIRIRAVPSGR